MKHLAYLDTSAFLKLVFVEDETDAIRTALTEWPNVVSSDILFVEAHRAGMRQHRQADVGALLQGVTLLSLTPQVRARAATIGTRLLRGMDAIHLATAEALEDDLGVLFTYDERMLDDGILEGLPLRAPTPE